MEVHYRLLKNAVGLVPKPGADAVYCRAGIDSGRLSDCTYWVVELTFQNHCSKDVVLTPGAFRLQLSAAATIANDAPSYFPEMSVPYDGKVAESPRVAAGQSYKANLAFKVPDRDQDGKNLSFLFLNYDGKIPDCRVDFRPEG